MPDLNKGPIPDLDVLVFSLDVFLTTFETGGLEGEVLQEIHLVSPKD